LAQGDNCQYYSNNKPLLPLISVVFRCGALSWIAGSFPTPDNVAEASEAARIAAYDAGAALLPGTAYDVARAAAYAASAACTAYSTHTVAGATYLTADDEVTAGAANAAADFGSAAARAVGAADNMWNVISNHCRYLEELNWEGDYRVDEFHTQPFWGAGRPDWFDAEWRIARETLTQTGQGFEIWRNWLQRRIDGKATGFDLPPDADAEISRRLIAASNDWWEREPAEVNADIKAWLTELTPPPDEPDEADFTQNPRALTFGADADGRIGLAPDLAANRLLDDTDAQDRHAEVRREAQALQAASQHGQTQATDLDQPTRDFIEALGESLVKTKPSWLVARGEKLRRMRAQRQNGTSLAPPLSERQAEAIDALITALDIMVGLDPYLYSIRQASYDPDIPRGSGDPVAIRVVIEHALEIKVARADAHDALLDGIENVPANAAPDDRRRLTLWADFKNFIQATGRFIWKHKGKITTGAVAAITLIQLNAAMLKGIFVASPTMLEIIRWIEMIKLPS
jgi:hypothetical protein